MAGSGIPAKGPGNGNPKHPPFGSGNAESQKGGFIRQKMARWRKENPDAPLTMQERDRLHREALRERIPEVLDAALEVATDNTHPDFKILAPMLIKQDMGNPKQAMDFSGEVAVGLRGYAVTPDVAATMEQWTEQALAVTHQNETPDE